MTPAPTAAPAPDRPDARSLERLFASTPDLLAVLDLSGAVTFMNPAGQRLLGYRAAEIQQLGMMTLVHPDDLSSATAAMEQALTAGAPAAAHECRLRRSDGAYVWMSFSGTVDAVGGSIYITARDVTERHEADQALRAREEELRQSQALLAEAQALAQVGSWNWDIVNNVVTWSEQLYRLYGVEPGATEPSFQGFLDALHPKDRARVSEAVRAALHAGGTFGFECRMVLGQGVFWRQVRGSVELAGDGTALRLFGVVRDISERRRVSAVERELAAIVSSSGAAIVGFTPDGAVTSWNKGAEQLYGYRADEMMGRSVNLLLPERALPGEPAVTAVAAGRRFSDQQTMARRQDGSLVAISLSAAPLIDEDGQVEGVASVAHDMSQHKAAERAMASAYQEARDLANRLEHQSQRMHQVNEMAELLQSCLDMAEARELIRQVGPRLFPGFSGTLFTLAPSRDLLEREAGWGGDEKEPVFAPAECWALRRGRLHIVEGHGEGLACRHLTGRGARYLCLPLMAQGETLGVLHLRARHGVAGELPRIADIAPLAATVAEHLSLALANFQLRETLRYQSIRDPLTGMFNRRYMEESMDRELARAARSGTTVGVIQTDLDFFKRFNDAYGHAAGDAVLRAFGTCVQGQMRAEDIACRYGGEEFTLVFPGADRLTTAARAEALRQAVAQIATESRGQLLGGITISAGVAEFPGDATTVDDLLRLADAALYKAKEAGRNRVVQAGLPGPLPLESTAGL